MCINVGEKDKALCSGCGICENACPVKCIKMDSDSEGFLYPIVDASICIKCSKCLRVCPFEKQNLLNHPIEFKEAQSKDRQTLENCSSGGIFGEVAKYILEQGGIVFGASYQNGGVEHIAVSEVSDLGRVLGSKYLQSDTKETFEECKAYLDKGKLVLYAGTGCQINALNHFLGKEYRNLYTIDIVCHGVPSRKLYSAYCKHIKSVRHKDISRINMRDKSDGWKSTRLRIYYKDGSSEFGTNLCHLWSKLFQYGFALRPSCYKCTFCQINRSGDLTLGDYWGYKENRSSLNNRLGISEILVNTLKGQNLIASINDKIEINTITEKEATTNQPQLLRPTRLPQERFQFYKHLSRWPFYFVSAHYCGYGVLGKIISRIRRFL